MSTSSRPYLLRAIYEWLLDNNLTPHIVINTDMPGVEVPSSHIENGQLVLNISPGACRNLLLGDEVLTFNARFNGASMQVSVPIDAVTAVYARENSLGMVFGQEPRLTEVADVDKSALESKEEQQPVAVTKPKSTAKKVSHLTIVK